MSIGYTWEKLYGAVLTLARSDGPLPHRLTRAILQLPTLHATDFPDADLWATYRTLRHALTPGAPGGPPGPTPASPAVLRPQEASHLVETLLGLYTDITRCEERHYRTLGGPAPSR